MSILEDWASLKNIKLFSDIKEPNIKFFYFSINFETMQVVLERRGRQTRIDLWSIETENDEEVHKVYFVDGDKIRPSLDTLLDAISAWLLHRQAFPKDLDA